MESKHRIENKILIVTTNGVTPSLSEIKTISKEMVELSLMSSCNKILLDDRQLSYSLTDVELFELGEYNVHIIPSIIRMAIVCAEKYYNKLKLWESISFSRGINVKIFLDFKAAQDWLTQTG